VPAVPRTFTGKKLEAPVKRIMLGARPDEVASRDALVDPTAIDAFAAYAAGSSRTTSRAGLSSRSPS
jgi:acetoacetyl-CoA synthetase